MSITEAAITAQARKIAGPLLNQSLEKIEAIVNLLSTPGTGITIEGDEELTAKVVGILRGAIHDRQNVSDADIFKGLS